MDRTPAAVRAAFHHSPPRIALLDTLGLKALVVAVRKSASFEARDHLDFIALGADRRLRWGTMWVIAEGPLPRPVAGFLPIHSCRPPTDAESLANEIARAVDAMDAGTALPASRDYPPFSLSGWSPATRGGFMSAGTHPTAPRAVPGFGWLGGEILGDEAANRLWDQAFAPLVTPADMEAVAMFEVAGYVDYAAFDACREVGPAGDARRSFARANPLLANVALRNPATRAMVDAGARTRDILDAVSVDGVVDLAAPGSAGRRDASKRALAALSGRTLVPDAPYRSQDLAISAAGSLPRDWLPTTRPEAVAFACLCDLAKRVYTERGQDADEGMWRQAMAGASGRWVEFALRVAEARGPFDGGDPAGILDTVEVIGLIGIKTQMTQHFVKDVLAPVSMTYGDGTASRLAGHALRGRGRSRIADALLGFGRESLMAGMALPAYADMLRRHAEARAAIRSVIQAYPKTTPAPGTRPHPHIVVLSNGMVMRPKPDWAGSSDPKADGAGTPSWSEVSVASMDSGGVVGLPDTMPDRDGRPVPQVAMLVKKAYANYAFEAPGAVEAMLDAWRRALPRRWRKLDTKGLAAAFDAEAAEFARTHGIEPRSPAPVPTL